MSMTFSHRVVFPLTCYANTRRQVDSRTPVANTNRTSSFILTTEHSHFTFFQSLSLFDRRCLFVSDDSSWTRYVHVVLVLILLAQTRLTRVGHARACKQFGSLFLNSLRHNRARACMPVFLACRLCFYVRYGIISEEPSQCMQMLWLTGYIFFFPLTLFWHKLSPRVHASVFGLSVMFLCSLWNHFGRTVLVHANALAHRLYFFGSVEPARACQCFWLVCYVFMFAMESFRKNRASACKCFGSPVLFFSVELSPRVHASVFGLSVMFLFYVTWLLPLSAWPLHIFIRDQNNCL